jgi:hypothetical protein
MLVLAPKSRDYGWPPRPRVVSEINNEIDTFGLVEEDGDSDLNGEISN